MWGGNNEYHHDNLIKKYNKFIRKMNNKKFYENNNIF